MEEFIKNFADQLFDPSIEGLNQNTVFRDLDDWDSLAAMAVIAMIEDKYNVQIENKTLAGLITIGDIFRYVEKHNKI